MAETLTAGGRGNIDPPMHTTTGGQFDDSSFGRQMQSSEDALDAIRSELDRSQTKSLHGGRVAVAHETNVGGVNRFDRVGRSGAFQGAIDAGRIVVQRQHFTYN